VSDLDAEFTQATQDVTRLPGDPGNEAKLSLYALFKQATVGDATGKRPSRFDMVGRAKYDAWAAISGTSSEDAKSQYVALVRRLGG
jgi:diazepam-binding inhibitor (GABA receptor modulator, acyl-CoA-binding protein)